MKEKKNVPANLDKVDIPKYWQKRVKRMKPGFIKLLKESAESEVVEKDDFGSYKLGTFLYESCVVSVTKDDGWWSVHIISDTFVSLSLIKQIRYKFVPDKAVMLQLFPSRKEANELKGYVLYEMPNTEEG